MSRLLPLAEPIRFGPYELTHRIARPGKLGETFRATQRGVAGFEKPLLIKQIYHTYSSHQPFIDRFVDRASAAVRLHHANIVQVLDLGLADARYFLATEFVAGYDLASIFDFTRTLGQRIPAPLVLLLGAETIKALDYAHRRKDPQLRVVHFCHQNLTPSNLMMSWDGEVKVTDFGVGEALLALPAPLRPGPNVLHRYSAPEVAAGQPASPSSDLYALGLVMYEALAGAHPFGAASAAPRALPPLRGNVEADDDLIALVERLLHPNPELRFGDASMLFEPFAHLMARHAGRANARNLADWLARLRDDASALPEEAANEAAPPVPLHDGTAQIATLDEAALTLTSSAVDAIQDIHHASGLWSVSALQQREFLELPRHVVPAGIEHAVDTLRQAYVSAQREGGRGYLILGEPGAGKSYIVRYLLSLFADAGSACHTAYLPAMASSLPLAIPALWLASAAGLLPSDTKATAQNKVRLLATTIDLDDREMRVVMRLTGLAPEGAFAPAEVSELACGIVLKLADKLAALGPVLLTVDNLQYTDRASYHFLLELVEDLPDHNVLLLLAAAERGYAHYFQHQCITILHHNEPSGEARIQVARAISADLPLADRTRMLLAHAPESLSRVVDMLALARAMMRTSMQADHAVMTLMHLDPSSRVATALSALSPPEIQALQWLAAAIEPLNVGLFRRLLGLPGPQARTVIQSLLALNLIIYPAPGCLGLQSREFSATLLSLYDRGVVTPLHQALAKLFERVSWDGIASPLHATVQEQFAHAGDAPGVLEHAMPYARRLGRVGYPEIALVHAQRGLADLHISRSESPHDRVRLHLDAAIHALQVLRWDLTEENMEAVFRAPGVRSTPTLWVEALATDAWICLTQRRFGEALQRLEQAQQAAEEPEFMKSPLHKQSGLFLQEVRATWCYEYGELIVAQELLEHALADFGRSDLDALGRLCALLTCVYARRGLVQQAQDCQAEGRKMANRTNSHVLEVLLRISQGEEALAREDFEEAWRVLDEGFDLADKSGHLQAAITIASRLVDVSARRGQGTRARTYMQHVRRIAKTSSTPAYAERVDLAQDALDAAYRSDQSSVSRMQQALNEAVEEGVPSEIIRVAGFLSEAYERQGDRQAAEAVMQREREARAKRGWA